MSFTQKLTFIPFTKENVLSLPQVPGVYIFSDELKHPLYVGKSISLKNRVFSYLANNLTGKTEKMIGLAKYFSYIVVNSEIEALLLEAHLVKKLYTQYNIELKDDKNPLYIVITKEKYPRVITARKKDTEAKSLLTVGPFPNSGNVRYVLSTLRRIFPYGVHKPENRPCLRHQLGLCEPCPSEIERTKDLHLKEILYKSYMKNIQSVKKILHGKTAKVTKELELHMKQYSDELNFEQAKVIRNRIHALEYITKPVHVPFEYLENPHLSVDLRHRELKSLLSLLKFYYPTIKNLNRIECFDIAHLRGEAATASMVVFKRGEADKSHYRHFKVYQKNSQSDTDSLAEIAERRKKHLNDWGIPDLIIVDGGKGQVSTFIKKLKDTRIPIVGIAKRFETLIIPDKTAFVSVRLSGSPLHLIQRLRDEAHRFARRYHHHLLKKKISEVGG